MKCRWCANPITSVSARYGAVMLNRGMVTPEAMRQAITPPPVAAIAPSGQAGPDGSDAA
jgi:hypothetical protein